MGMRSHVSVTITRLPVVDGRRSMLTVEGAEHVVITQQADTYDNHMFHI